MAIHNELGKAGEDAAAEMLQQKGYRILHRNWKCKRKELDIVALQGNTLVVVEVKTRRNDYFGSPLESITDSKIRNIITATQAYVRFFRMDYPIRFDVVSIIPQPKGLQIQHIEDAFKSPIW